MNDRQRIESAIMPTLLFVVLLQMREDERTSEEAERFEFIFMEVAKAAHNAFDDLPQPRISQLMRRLKRTTEPVATLMHGATHIQCLMATYYVFESLLTEERLSVYEGTSIANALMQFMAMIDQHFNEEKLDRDAQEMARAVRCALEQEGYFR